MTMRSFLTVLVLLPPLSGCATFLDVYTALSQDCPDVPPTPELVFTGTEQTQNSTGKAVSYYKLKVENRHCYPRALFKAAPDLPPCGRNENASRTWLRIFDKEGYVYGYCGLRSPRKMKQFGFLVQQGEAPPDSVYIVLWEGFFSGYVSGIRLFSVRHYAAAMMHGLDPRRFADMVHVGSGVAFAVAAGVFLLFVFLSVRRLRRMDVP